MDFKDWRKIQNVLRNILLEEGFDINVSSHHIFEHYVFFLTNVCVLIISFSPEDFFITIREKGIVFDLHKNKLLSAQEKMKEYFVKKFGA